MKWLLRILALTGGSLLAAVLTLVLMGHRPGAGQFSTTIDIHAPADRIWPWLEDGERAKKWVDGLVEVKRSGPVTSPVGSKEIWMMKDPNMGNQLMPVEGTCTAYDRPLRLSVHLQAPSFSGSQTYLLTPASGGRTRLTVSGHYEFPGWFEQLMEPLISPAARRKMAGDLKRLKTAVESSPG